MLQTTSFDIKIQRFCKLLSTPEIHFVSFLVIVQDEASLHLTDNARIFLQSLGSSYASQIKWRTMWAFVIQHLKTHNIIYGESIQHSTGHEKWGEPVHLRTMVPLQPEVHVKCDWDDSEANRRRREFCDKYEGYRHVCSCKCF